jgi:hypothetical protein
MGFAQLSSNNASDNNVLPPVPPNPGKCKIVSRPCNLTFSPDKLKASENLAGGGSEMVTVTARCGSVSLTATIKIIKVITKD